MLQGLVLVPAMGAIAAPNMPPDVADLLPGTFSNEEQVYFDKDAGRKAAPWMSLRISIDDGNLMLEQIDAKGKAIVDAQEIAVSNTGKRSLISVGHCGRYFDRTEGGWTYSAMQNRMACQQAFQIIAITRESITLQLNNGTETILKRARPVTCWAAIPKSKAKEDGDTDWLFSKDLKLHDQGGRVTVGGGDSGAEAVTLRMRAVHWPPPSTNRPSMVLYIHKDDPDRAASYSWADIDASRVGLNLRWMQASCTIEGAERVSGD
ncbi:MAG: hypothetical protein ABJF89_06765 [Parasphingorhabdus sp.]|uniref:hypothetical protein n=3 Tax=Parasphingorhabdus sp. TaxID=2709688 RepID=UPI0032658518